MTFSLQTFGRLQLLDAEGKTVAFPEKGLLVLAYLLTTDEGSERRATLAQFLWGDADKNASLVNLRKAISRFKSRQDELGAEFFSFTDSVISVGRTAVASDLLSLHRKDFEEPLVWLGRLVALFNRTFLGPVNCQSRSFDLWLIERKNYHTALLKGLLKETFHSARTPNHDEIIKNAAILIFQAEPEDPDTVRLLIELFNAEEEVEYFRKYFEQRKQLIARGDTLVGATSDKGPAKGAMKARASEGFSAWGIPIADFPSQSEKTPTVGIPRLALLPPTNVHRDPMVAMVASSLIEDITIGFCALNSLEVIAPHTAVRIGKTSEDKTDVLERYDITYVLDTRLSGIDNEDLSLFVQLVYSASSEIVWAERYSLNKLELISRRRDILRQITLSVAGRIESHQVARPYFERSAAAYHRYLVGRHHLNRLTLPNLRRSRKELKGALQEDANFAPALSSLARTFSKEWLLTARGDLHLLETAAEFATRAIEARRDFADGYRELGVAKLLMGSIDESVEALEVSETLSPHYADIIADHADTLNHFSRPDLALQKLERAIELNPLSPDSYLWTAAGASYSLGNFEGALGYIDKMVDGDLADRLSAASWAMLGNEKKSRFFVRRALEANPQFDIDKWLAIIPFKEQWQKDIYREGLKKAGF
jgi:TolB-like protein/DNA-binding SARP family transcriptional activator